MDTEHSPPNLSDHWTSQTGGRLVVVDDEPLNVSAIEEFLRKAGYIHIAGMALSECTPDRLRDARPDMVLIELDPQSAPAFEVLRWISEDRVLRDVPVIVLATLNDHPARLRALGLGVTEVLLKPIDPSELLLRLRNAMVRKYRRDQLVQSDSITGLPNRDTLSSQLHWAIKNARRHDSVGAVLQVGLDRFKHISDALGPALGDELLSVIAQRLQSGLRETDGLVRADPDASVMIAHSRSDEFTILLPTLDDANDASKVAQRVVDLLTPTFVIHQQELFISCRVGIAVFPVDSIDKDTLLKQASVAMGHASQTRVAGQNSCHFYSGELNANAVSRLNLEREFRHAIDRNELRVYYQPKIKLHSGELYSAEALVRWQHPQRGLLGPAAFLGMVESCGLIGVMGEWVLCEALRQMAVWRDANMPLPTVAVNVSSLQFENADFADQVKRALQTNGLPGSCLCLELTESAIIDVDVQTTNSLKQIKSLGVELSLDDFGTGYSSLSYLRKFPLDEIKIDRSFITDCDHDSNSAAITTAIIAMGHSLNLRVVAEGIEKASQLSFISAQGCDVYQGNFYAPALPVAEFSAILALDQKDRARPQ